MFKLELKNKSKAWLVFSVKPRLKHYVSLYALLPPGLVYNLARNDIWTW